MMPLFETDLDVLRRRRREHGGVTGPERQDVARFVASVGRSVRVGLGNVHDHVVARRGHDFHSRLQRFELIDMYVLLADSE